MNVSEFDNVENATEAMITTLQAYGVEAENSIEIVDKLNIVGNNFAISSDGIAEGLQRSAATLVEAGNSLEQSIAMMAAGNKVIQDPEMLGSALKVLAMRIRGTKTELEEMGESTDGMVTNTSKLRDQVKALTSVNGKSGVDILSSTGEYRDTYDILVDIAEVYDEIVATDSKKAAGLTELLAGKHRANVLSAILQNPEDLKNAYDMALNSDGSAMAENEKYLDSIQGKMDKFTNALQTMWMDTLDSSVVKGVIDLGTALIKVVDTIGVLPTLLVAVSTGFMAIKKINPVTLFKDLDAQLYNYGLAMEKVKAIQSLNTGAGAIDSNTYNANNINAYASAVSGLTAKQQAQLLAMQGLNQEQIKSVLISNEVSEGNIQEALSEANVITAKQQAIAATAGEVGAIMEKNGVTLSSTALNYLNEHSTKEVTEALLAAAVAAGAMTEEEKRVIMATLGMITTNNAASFSFKALGASIKAAFMSNPVGMAIMAITTAISIALPLIDAFTKSNEELIDQADEVRNAYNQEVSSIGDHISTLQGLESEFATLSKGVDTYGNNISLATDDYARYQEIVQQIIGISPELIAGYDAEGNAIANKNDLLKKAIELEQEKQRVEAQKMVGDDGRKDIYKGYLAKVNNAKTQEQEGYTGYRADAMKIDMNKLKKQYSSDLTGFLQVVPQSLSSYYKLESAAQTFLAGYINSLDTATIESEEDLKAMQSNIEGVTNALANNKAFRTDALNASKIVLGEGLDVDEYMQQIKEFRAKINNSDYTDAEKQSIFEVLGWNTDSSEFENNVIDAIDHTKALLKDGGSEASREFIDNLSVEDVLLIQTHISAEPGTMSIDELKEKIQGIRETQGIDITTHDTYSTLSASVDSYNEVLTQSAEVVANNVEVTQEYKDSLIALSGSEEKVNACFYEGNPLVVKNAQALQEVLASSRDNITANIELAKSQSRFQYSELVQKLGDICDTTKDLTNEQIANAHATMDQIDAVQQAIYKYQLLETQLNAAGGAFEKFNQAKEVDALNTTGSSYLEMAQTVYDAFYKTGEVGTQAFDAAVQALIPDSVYASLESDGDKLKAIYKYFNNKVLPSLTLDNDALSITQNDIEDFVNKGLSKGLLSGSTSNGLKIVDEMNLEKGAKLMGMTEASLTAMLAELDKYDYNTSAESFLSQIDDSFDSQVMSTTSKLQKLNEQKLALLENGGYEKNKKQINEINAEIDKCGGSLEKLQTKAVESYEAYANNQGVIESLNTIDDKTQKISYVMDKQTAMEIGLDWDESKNLTVQEALDDILAKQTELEEPTELMIQFAQEGLVDEIDGLISKIEKDKKVKLDIEYDSESGEYNIDDSKYLKRNSDGKIELTGNLKNDDNAKQLVKQINLLESLQNFADNGMVTTEELLGNISDTLNSLHKEVTGKNAPGEDGRKTNKGVKDLSDIDSKKGLSDTEKEIQSKKTELSELKKKHKELKNKAAAGDEDAAKKQKKNAKAIKAAEQELAQLRKDNMDDYLKQIDNLSKIDKQAVIETAVDYQKGDQSFDDLMEKINSIEDKKVRLQVVTKLVESGAFDELFENADTIDKTVIIKAITQGTENVDLLNEVINHLPEEVQPEVRALVDGALDNIEIVDGKLKLVDGKTSTANVEVNTENAQETISYWERKIANIDEVDPIELGLKEDATNDEKIAAIQKKIDKLKKDSKIDVTVGEKDSAKGSGKKNLKDEEQKLAQLKSEKDKLGYQAKNEDINKIGPWLAKSAEYNKQKEIVIPLRIEKYQEDFEKIDNLVEEDRTIAINAITKYENGGSIEDLMSELGAIEDEDVRLEVIATLTKDGAFDELLSSLSDEDKKIVVKALTEGKGDVNELNNIIDSLPPEVQSQVRALVGGALSNLNVVDGKLKEVDNTKPTPTVDVNDKASSTLGTLLASMSTLDATSASPKVSVAVTGLQLLQKAKDLIDKLKGGNVVNGTAHAMGTAWAGGTALKGGRWGAKKTETALVGELGPEMVIRGNHWFTVGDQGAEFTGIRKGDIIFNHQQTEEIFKNGYITSRGRIAKANGTAHAQGTVPKKGSAWAEGTAYALWTPGSSSTKLKQTGKAKTKQGKSGNSSKGSKDFEELFDWFEIKIEEINESLDLMGAKLANAVDLTNEAKTGKNDLLQQMIDKNKEELSALDKGYKLYNNYSKRLLKKIPKKYRAEAQNGKIALEEFKGKTSDETLQKIKEYREWAQKAADLKKQIQEVKSEIADLAKQKFDNIEEAYNNMMEVYNRQPINRIQNYIDFTEESGNIASAKSYEEMIRQEQDAQDKLIKSRDEMQKSLDESVKKGDIQRESPQWWEAVKAIQAMNEEIDAAALNIEKYNNAINDIKWKVFDTTISRIDALSNETQNLIDLMGDVEDAIEAPDYESGWGAADVKWTKEGLTSLGLYAQQMEIAQEKAKQYQKAIEELDADYKAEKYSANEYYEKLSELKDGQYDAIKSYHDAKDAIVELNEARIDAIKEGIEREIQSYQELIDKKKEELSAEKD